MHFVADPNHKRCKLRHSDLSLLFKHKRNEILNAHLINLILSCQKLNERKFCNIR